MSLLQGIKSLEGNLVEKLRSNAMEDVSEEEEDVGIDYKEAYESFHKIEESLDNNNIETEISDISEESSLLFSKEEREEPEENEVGKKVERRRRTKVEQVEEPEQRRERQQKVEEIQPERQQGTERREKPKQKSVPQQPEQVVKVKTRRHERGGTEDQYLNKMRDLVQEAKQERSEREVVQEARKTPVNLTPEGEVEGYYGKGEQALQTLRNQLNTGQAVQRTSSRKIRGAKDKEEYLKEMSELVQRQIDKKGKEEVIERAMKTPVQVDPEGEVRGYFGRGENALQSLRRELTRKTADQQMKTKEEKEEKTEKEELKEEIEQLEEKIGDLDTDEGSKEDREEEVKLIEELKSVVKENRQKIHELAEKVREIDTDKSRNSKEVKRIRNQFDQLQEDLGELKSEIESSEQLEVGEEDEEIENALSHLVKEIEVNSEAVEELREKYVEGDATAGELDLDPEKLEKLKEKAEEMEDLSEDVSEHQNRIEGLMDEFREIKEKLAGGGTSTDVPEEVRENSNKIEDLRKELKKFREKEASQDEDLQEKIESLRNTVEGEEEASIEELYKEVELLSEAILEIAEDSENIDEGEFR